MERRPTLTRKAGRPVLYALLTNPVGRSTAYALSILWLICHFIKRFTSLLPCHKRQKTYRPS